MLGRSAAMRALAERDKVTKERMNGRIPEVTEWREDS